MGLRRAAQVAGVAVALLLLGAVHTEDSQLHIFPGGLQSGPVAVGTQAFRAESFAGSATGTRVPGPSVRTYFGSGRLVAAGPLVQTFDPTAPAPADPPCPAGTGCFITVTTVCHCNGGANCSGGALDASSANVSVVLVANTAGTIATQGAVQVPVATQIGSASIASIAVTVATPNIVTTVAGSAFFNNTCAFVYTVTPVGT